MTDLLLVFKATALLAGALLAVHVCRRTPAAFRALVLTVTLALLLILPVAVHVLPPLVVDVTPALATAAAQVRSVAPDPEADLVGVPVAGVRSGDSEAVERGAALSDSFAWMRGVTLTGAIRAIWLLGATLVGTRIALGMRGLRRLRRGGRPWPQGAAAVQQLVHSRSAASAEIVLLPGLAAPITYGIVRPVVALPGDAAAWPEGDLRRALIHELEHVRRADWAAHLLSRLVCALYWFHPLVWIAARRLRVEMEHACDDAVVRCDEAAAYAQQLVGLARHLSAHPVPEPLGMAASSSLSERVGAVLDPSRRRGPVSVAHAAAALTMMVAFGAAIAPLAAQRQATERETLAIPISFADRAFDTVTIHRGSERGGSGARAFDFSPDSGSFRAHGQTLRSLIAFAYSPIPGEETLASWPLSELPDWRLRGGPEWVDTERFTIDARAHQPIAPAELAGMVRRLLVDRFALAVHVEQHESRGYRLRRADANGSLGPGLRPASASCADRDAQEGGGPGHIELRCASLSAYVGAYHLMEVLGGPVVDRTGLTGSYDVSVVYVPTEDELRVIYELQATDLPREMLSRPSIVAAFERQLGLTLEPIGVLVDTLVVDGATVPQGGGTSAEARFEVTSVKPVRDRAIRGYRPDPGQFTGQMALIHFIALAYGMPQSRVVGRESVLGDVFSISGKIPTGANGGWAPMLRTLLEERFDLKVHRETRDMRVYALVKARSDGRLGPNLRPASGCSNDASSKGPRCGYSEYGPDNPGIAGQNDWARFNFAGILSRYVDRHVVDRTGLSGEFALRVNFAYLTPPLTTGNTPVPEGPSLFAALEEQLGLKLESAVEPLEVLVIDAVSRPTPD